MKRTFVRESFFSSPADVVFRFHEQPDAFRLLTPDFAGVQVQTTASTLEPTGELVKFTTRFAGIPLRFAMAHTVYDPPSRFVDEQRQGIFSTWRHEHRFDEGGWREAPATRMQDRIALSHPLLLLAYPFVRARLEAMFRFRHEVTRQHTLPAPALGPEGQPLRVAVTGATGLIGKRVVDILLDRGAQVTVLVRSPSRARRLWGGRVALAAWDFHHPDEGDWVDGIARADGVVHLAGTPLFSHRWTASFKREMEQSRVEGTRQLVDAMRHAEHRPAVFVSASAQGIYGTDPERVANEDAPHADDTLARICTAWEAEAEAAESFGVRTALMRTGIVLSTESGALKEMLPLFRLGAGAVLGERHPWINWIHLEDTAQLYVMALLDEQVRGPLNVVAPHPVRNETLARTLARVLGRPCWLRLPTWLLQLAIGEAGAFASGGARVTADRAQRLGYRFFFQELEPALRSLLRR